MVSMIQELVVERTILMLGAKAQLSSGCLVFFFKNGQTNIDLGSWCMQIQGWSHSLASVCSGPP